MIKIDMSKYWKLVFVTVKNEELTNSIHGTWWVSESHVKPVDVTIYDETASYGRVFYSGDFIGDVRDGIVPVESIRLYTDKQEAEDSLELIAAAMTAAVEIAKVEK